MMNSAMRFLLADQVATTVVSDTVADQQDNGPEVADSIQVMQACYTQKYHILSTAMCCGNCV